MQVLALDVGTSSVKAAVVEVSTARPAGDIVRVAYPLEHPTPDAAEIHLDKLWQAVTEAGRKAGRGHDPIDGVGLSCLMPALVLLDEQDRPLGPAWTHLDRRSRIAARQAWTAGSDELLHSIGNRPLPGGISAVCWKQQYFEDTYLHRRVRSYLHLNGWLGLRLTGQRAFDKANACFTGLFNTLGDQRWSQRWCDFFEVDRSWLPDVLDGRATLGTLNAQAAGELGIVGGIPVKLGTADTSSAILAANMKEGDLLHVMGTTQVLAGLTTKPVPSVKRLTRLLGVGDAFVHVTHNPVGGAALDWLHQLCFREQDEEEFFDSTIPAALERSTRVALEPPFLGGDRLEIEASRAAFRNLTLASNRDDLLAAVLTAMRKGQRDAIAQLGLGESFRTIHLTGGGAELVQQLLPEYQGANVHAFEEGSLLGVACLFR
ncbi:MAG: FGGY-family carbohydrate kinase [Gemmataceae bacterium]